MVSANVVTVMRKWPVGNRMVTWPTKSRDPERSSRDPSILKQSSIAKRAGDAI